jgi:protease II
VSTSDLAACASHVVRRGFSSPARVAAAASSAGGAVLTSAAARWPHLFRTLLLRAPFLAVAAAMRREQQQQQQQQQQQRLPLAAEELAEWGDPREPAQREKLERFCAVEQLAAQPCASPAPAFLVQGSTRDARAPAWGMMRWALQTRRSSQAHTHGEASLGVLALRDDGDHRGGKMEDATEVAFMLKVIRQHA